MEVTPGGEKRRGRGMGKHTCRRTANENQKQHSTPRHYIKSVDGQEETKPSPQKSPVCLQPNANALHLRMFRWELVTIWIWHGGIVGRNHIRLAHRGIARFTYCILSQDSLSLRLEKSITTRIDGLFLIDFVVDRRCTSSLNSLLWLL